MIDLRPLPIHCRFEEVGRTYPTAEDYRRGITGGYTAHMQLVRGIRPADLDDMIGYDDYGVAPVCD